MATKKRTRAQHENDLIIVSRLFLQNWPHEAITSMINANRPYTISRSQISRDIATIRKRWRDEYLKDYGEAQMHELARLEQLEAEYWQAWERSKRDLVSTQAVDIQDNMNGSQTYSRKKHLTKSEKQTGREEYLQGIQWCIEQRCKILGLIAPKAVKINWRAEVEELGINPDEIRNELVSQFILAAENGLKKPGSKTSPPDSD